ncbi:serine/threonine-protein kinase [Streptomyces oceani]|uniref:non-specific serine/threonine protein kinase n=1 Tax=Streptomyces oceani TaxID=1075402 RepID=A0A1E7KHT5_9ACTN|nr:serine/threonine-protein kinase [Streptomyces oceani]OEV03518.1 hypothetical protein AN216_11745 [Streptomyces oceani]
MGQDVEDGRLLGGRYRLGGVLGRGGMGTVWRGHDEMLGRPVAVKELRFPSSVDEEEKQRLVTRTLREAKAIARIRSDSAITVYDVVNEDDRPWIVMELIEGLSLADQLRDHGPLEQRRVAEVGLAVLDVLRAAHQEGILHRDVKPSNVLLEEGTDRVILTDFGIAKVAGDPSITSTGMLVGAPSYISPERARGKPPGPPADLWSLGGLLYAAVEGRPPYDKGSALSTLTAVMTEPVPTPSRAGALSEVIFGLLQKDPDQRLDVAGARSLLEMAAAGKEAGKPHAAGQEPTHTLPLISHRGTGRGAHRSGSSKGGSGGQASGTRLRDAWKSVRSAAAADAAGAGAGGAAGAGAAGAGTTRGAAGSRTAGRDSGADVGAEASGGSGAAARSGGAAGSGAVAGPSAQPPDTSGTSGPAAGPDPDAGAGSAPAPQLPRSPQYQEPTAGARAPAPVPAEPPPAPLPPHGSGGGVLPALSGSALPPANSPAETVGLASGSASSTTSTGVVRVMRDLGPRRTTAMVLALLALLVALTVAISFAGTGEEESGASGGQSDTESGGRDGGADDKDGQDTGGGQKEPDGGRDKGDTGGKGKDDEDGKDEADGKDDGKGGDGPKIPKGYAVLTDKRFNFQMAMPKNYKRVGVAGDDSGGQYGRPGGGYPKIQVDYNDSPLANAVLAWKGLEPAVRKSSNGYRPLFIRNVKWRGYPTVADWSFERNENGERVRVLNRGFKVDDKRGYAIMITCKAENWDNKMCRTVRNTAFATFQPR